jgi:hypothetical protein
MAWLDAVGLGRDGASVTASRPSTAASAVVRNVANNSGSVTPSNQAGRAFSTLLISAGCEIAVPGAAIVGTMHIVITMVDA